jgi:hypothetical protein
MLEDQRQTRPIWLAAGDVRPDEGEPAQNSVDTADRSQSVRLQQFSRRVTVAKRPVWSLSFHCSGQGGRPSGESWHMVLTLATSLLLPITASVGVSGHRLKQ